MIDLWNGADGKGKFGFGKHRFSPARTGGAWFSVVRGRNARLGMVFMGGPRSGLDKSGWVSYDMAMCAQDGSVEVVSGGVW